MLSWKRVSENNKYFPIELGTSMSNKDIIKSISTGISSVLEFTREVTSFQSSFQKFTSKPIEERTIEERNQVLKLARSIAGTYKIPTHWTDCIEKVCFNVAKLPVKESPGPGDSGSISEISEAM